MTASPAVGEQGRWRTGRGTDASVVVPTVVGLALVETVLIGVSGWSAQALGAALVAPALVVLAIPIVRRAAEKLNDARLAPFLLWALVLKLIGGLARYSVLTDVYDGVGDAPRYDAAGRTIAALFRSGVFDIHVRKVVGTGFIEIVTGVVYTFVGSNQIAGFLVFSWLGFWGLVLFYSAFCLACPDGDRRRYGLLLFLLPSMLFWPSSIGKEAWMMFALGLAAYGAARILTRSRGGFLVISLGLLGTAMVRPHVTLMLLLAFSVAYVLRRSPKRSTFGPFGKIAGITVLVVASVVVVDQAERFLGVDTLNQGGIEEAITRTQQSTSQGGSSFEAAPARSPAQLPGATVSMLFRPFPYEAHNLQALVASLEGLLLLGCFLLSWRRICTAPRALLRSPYVAMAGVYSLLFIYAFSSFANFGILTRERVQLFPFVLVVLALPASTVVPRRRSTTPTPILTRELVR